MRMKKKLRILLLAVLIIVSATAFTLWKRNKERAKEEMTQIVLEDESSNAVEEVQEPEPEETIVYTKPQYDFKTDELLIEIPGIRKEYTIAWVSDLHMVTDMESAEDVREEDLAAIEERHEFFKTEDGLYGEELLPEIIDYLNYERFDSIIFGGDMLDYCSQSNIDRLSEELERLNSKVPALYIRADHDYGFWYGGDTFTEADAEKLHSEMADGDDLEKKYLDMDEFMIVGVNRSTKDMFPEQYEILDRIFAEAEAKEKPVIVATHVPYESKVDESNAISLYNRSMEVRNKIYYWGGGDYVPNEVTRSFFEKIYKPDTAVRQVLAGHLHAGWDGAISEQVKEHIFEPTYRGSIGIIRVVPKEEQASEDDNKNFE